MYLKLRKFYSASSNQGSGGTITLNVEKVKIALNKFDNLESSLKKIVNATNNSSNVKPSDLVNIEKVTITSDSGVEIKPLSSSSSTTSGRPMISTYSYLVIDRVRKLCDDIVKADSLQLITTEEDDSLLDSVPASEDIVVDDNQYVIENSIIPPAPSEENADVNSSDYIIEGDIIIDDSSESKVDIPSENEHIIESIVVPPTTGTTEDDVIVGDYIILDKDVSDDISNVDVIDHGKDQYTIGNTMIGIDSNGNKVTINPGNYDIVDTKKDSNGNITDICIMVNGEKIWISLKFENNNFKEESSIENKKYTIKDTITIIDKDGNKITINPGNYDIVDMKKDSNGNITDICIMVNGEKIWISLKFENNNFKEESSIENKKYTIKDTITIIDKDGNKITINPDNYDIVDMKKDSNGNITDICINVNGTNVWLSITNGKIVGNNLNIVNNQYNLENTLIITDLKGNKIIVKPGSYEIVDVKKDANGNITAICIAVDENYVWLVINNGQITSTMLQTSYDGMYVFNDVLLNIYDNNGNIIGTVTNGRYNVYEVIVDNNGKITWIRISKDGEPKYWINVYFQETDWGIFVTYESEVKHDNGVLKLFDKNKGSLIGVLGILIVGLGAIMYAKKSKKNKNVDNGTFAVYEVVENEEGKIDEVRVSPDDYEDECWIKF